MTMEGEILEHLLMDTTVTFQDVCGYSDAIYCLKKYTDDIKTLTVTDGKQVPRRPLLLYGHPGVGKTLLLKAAAAEAQFKLLVFTPYLLAGRMFPSLGVSNRAFEIVFSIACKNAPCILCFEDVSVWRDKEVYGNAEEEFLLQLQQHQQSLMNSGDKNAAVAVVITSMRPWLLDVSLLNKLRLLHLDLPSKEMRIDLLKFYLKNYSSDLNDAKFNELGDKTKGFTGADICCLARDAAMQEVLKISKATFFKKALVLDQRKETEEQEGNDLTVKGRSSENEIGATSLLSKEPVTLDTASTVKKDLGQELTSCEEEVSPHVTEKFIPCQETDEGAMRLSFWDLEPETIHCPDQAVTSENVMVSLARLKPSIAAEESGRMLEFRTKFGG